jgi:starch synthase
MIGPRYGTLPIAHNTGGLRDTVTQLSDDYSTGNGFVFDYFDASGLRWAIDQAMAFHNSHREIREATISRIMRESANNFSTEIMCEKYSDIYQKLSK